MGKFYSIPGLQYDNTRERRPSVADMAASNPNFADYRKARDESDGTSTGMAEGERCWSKDVPAIMHHEEYDRHTGEVKQVVQKSSQTGSGTYEMTWQKTGRGRMVLTRERRIYE